MARRQDRKRRERQLLAKLRQLEREEDARRGLGAPAVDPFGSFDFGTAPEAADAAPFVHPPFGFLPPTPQGALGPADFGMLAPLDSTTIKDPSGIRDFKALNQREVTNAPSSRQTKTAEQTRGAQPRLRMAAATSLDPLSPAFNVAPKLDNVGPVQRDARLTDPTKLPEPQRRDPFCDGVARQINRKRSLLVFLEGLRRADEAKARKQGPLALAAHREAIVFVNKKIRKLRQELSQLIRQSERAKCPNR